jgi:hypothetical protein
MPEQRPAVDIKCDTASAITGEVAVRCVAFQRVAGQPKKKRSLPSFFVVGPPRTGSSWLHQILSPHTHLPGPAKETRFFDKHFHRGLNWYLAHYSKPDGTRRMGEVSPTYFASGLARERISHAVPDAKIFCVFRNPVERIVSLYRLKRAYGLIPWHFEQAMDRDPELLETSKYAAHLKLWWRAFGSENVLAGLYDDLRRSPQAFLNELVDFIEVPRFTLSTDQCACVHDSERMTQPRSYLRTRSATLTAEWFKSRRMDRVVSLFRKSPLLKFALGGGKQFAPLPPGVIAKLYEKFLPEVEELEALLQRDLCEWKHPKEA